MGRDASPVLWFIAGPKGVGKTTYAYREIRKVSGSVHFVNLHEIARGLSPLDPQVARDAAGRVAIQRIRGFIDQRLSFSLETTLSGRTHLLTIERAHQAGFHVRLLYFMVSTIQVCLTRIARRVLEGGHDVPEVDVRRRFDRSIGNFSDYVVGLDRWTVFDNSGPTLLTSAEGRRGCIAIRRDVGSLPAALIAQFDQLPTCAE